MKQMTKKSRRTTAADADPGVPPGLMAAPREAPPTCQPLMDANGLPMRGPRVPHHRLSLIALGSSIVSMALAITDVVAFGILAGYLLACGMACAFAGVLVGGIMAETKKVSADKEARVHRIARAATALGFLAFILLLVGSGNGNALNDAP